MKEKDTRRDFLKKGLAGLGVCVCSSSLISALQSCESFTEFSAPGQGITKELNIASEIDFPNEMDRKLLKMIGYGVKVKFDDANFSIPVIILRLSEDEMACFSSLCTHDNCFGDDITPSLGYFETPEQFKEYRYIICGCHGSRFDPFQNGKAVTGPAEKPLKRSRQLLIRKLI